MLRATWVYHSENTINTGCLPGQGGTTCDTEYEYPEPDLSQVLAFVRSRPRVLVEELEFLNQWIGGGNLIPPPTKWRAKALHYI